MLFCLLLVGGLVPVDKVHFRDVPSSEAHKDRWLMLCQALGSIPTFQRTTIWCDYDGLEAVSTLIENIRQARHLRLYAVPWPARDIPGLTWLSILEPCRTTHLSRVFIMA
jgi:hypothetical protein